MFIKIKVVIETYSYYYVANIWANKNITNSRKILDVYLGI